MILGLFIRSFSASFVLMSLLIEMHTHVLKYTFQLFNFEEEGVSWLYYCSKREEMALTQSHVSVDMMFLIIAGSQCFVEEVVAVTWFVDPSYVEKGMFDLPCCFKGSLYAG